MQRTLGPGVTISPNFPLRLRSVVADRTQLELAVMNLMVNARDAMPNGGTITVSARELDQAEGKGGFVCLSIKDEGEGMDAETLAHATDPFFTTKGVGKGTGLGLSMVQGMVEQCGGRLVLESSLGKGTTAEIWLPVAELEAKKEVAGSDDLPSSGKALRILAVDDDAIILLNTATILDDMGHDVLQAHSARSALEIIQQEDVDLLITDYSMPKMTGAELVQQALKAKPDLKVIVASGYADLPEGTALDVPRLAKPFSEHDLANAIAALSD
jgi:CheY-like chemotaxis protein